jgi:hypothetical protein
MVHVCVAILFFLAAFYYFSVPFSLSILLVSLSPQALFFIINQIRAHGTPSHLFVFLIGV